MASAGAAAERIISPDDEANNFLFIPVGTGVSSAIVVNGALVRGATGAAGEFGHMQVVPDGEPCTCGQSGCIEAYASARAVAVRYARAGGAVGTSARDITARLGWDAIATSVWAEAIGALATGIMSLIAVLDPSRVVIGGGLSAAGPELIEPLNAAVTGALAWRQTPPIVASALVADAGLIGAALLSNPGGTGAADFVTRARIDLGLSARQDRQIVAPSGKE